MLISKRNAACQLCPDWPSVGVTTTAGHKWLIHLEPCTSEGGVQLFLWITCSLLPCCFVDPGVSVGGDEQKRWPPLLHHHHARNGPVPQRHGSAQLCPQSGMKR